MNNLKLDPCLKLKYKISQYENSLKLINETIKARGTNNHIINVQFYYEMKIESLKMGLTK